MTSDFKTFVIECHLQTKFCNWPSTTFLDHDKFVTNTIFFYKFESFLYLQVIVAVADDFQAIGCSEWIVWFHEPDWVAGYCVKGEGGTAKAGRAATYCPIVAGCCGYCHSCSAWQVLRHRPYPRPPEWLWRQLDWVEHGVDLALDRRHQQLVLGSFHSPRGWSHLRTHRRTLLLIWRLCWRLGWLGTCPSWMCSVVIRAGVFGLQGFGNRRCCRCAVSSSEPVCSDSKGSATEDVVGACRCLTSDSKRL